ncbi:MAG: YceI family protein [Parvibaculum sp.]|uniref:YceI family protein n=1 Tax=Parvibaculum sp. TaxID=2024848 RepID=UPI0025E38C3C|nr:YceI family protein [Parvibaculum sp.]MCE9648663.1 YceI family protein [Parvibaculum sp.]
MRKLAFLFLALALSSCTAIDVVTHSVSDDPVKAPAGAYTLDPHHWSVLFDVDHFGYSRFVTRFDKVEATLDAVPGAPEKSRVHVTIKAASVDTNDPELDSMLTGPDMFDAAKFPDITFTSTSVKRTGPKTGDMTGNLTIRGRTHPVTLVVTFNGGAPDPLTGLDTLGFSATGNFDRSQWGLSAWWPAVGNDVHVAVQAEFTKPRHASNGTSNGG